MDSQKLSDVLKEAAKEADAVARKMSLMVDDPFSAVESILDSKRATYAEWIKREGAEICLYQDMDMDTERY